MNTRRFHIAFSIPLFMFLNHCNGQTDSAAETAAQEIQKSHIEGNVPKKKSFELYLKRDLEKYFLEKYGKVTIKWEYLRLGETQSGVAYPKYYLWTKVFSGEQMINEGAIRVAAIEKTHFDITNFVPIAEIRKGTVNIYEIFPGAVCETIKLHL